MVYAGCRDILYTSTLLLGAVGPGGSPEGDLAWELKPVKGMGGTLIRRTLFCAEFVRDAFPCSLNHKNPGIRKGLCLIDGWDGRLLTGCSLVAGEVGGLQGSRLALGDISGRQ